MGFFSRWLSPKSAKSDDTSAAAKAASEDVDPIDNSLPDNEWLARSEARYKQMVQHRWGSCETVAQGGADRYGHQDFGTALFFFQKSIDMLHTNYLFGQMRSRQPSPADAWIVDGYTSALGASLQLHPTAPVDDSVREVTHRLRTIASTCDRVGLSAQIYRGALDLIAVYASHVRLDDVLG